LAQVLAQVLAAELVFSPVQERAESLLAWEQALREQALREQPFRVWVLLVAYVRAAALAEPVSSSVRPVFQRAFQPASPVQGAPEAAPPP
jgi:hypothetical protein